MLKPESLYPLFQRVKDERLVVIHTAGLIDVTGEMSRRLYDVNVTGTKNVLALCAKYQVEKLVYVSSVHAIPETGQPTLQTEITEFSPETVVGGYAKTKSEATQAVLDAAANGLPAVVVHPSGIIGPYDEGRNHLVQMVRDFMEGRLPACVKGGYLLLIEDRRTHTCHPSYNTIAAETGVAKNTAMKSISTLLDAGLITMEYSQYFDKRGMKWKGNNLYTILPTQAAVGQFHQRQLNQLELDAERRRVRKRQERFARDRPHTTPRGSWSWPNSREHPCRRLWF